MTAKFLVGLLPKPMLMLVSSPGVASPWQTWYLGLRANWDNGSPCPRQGLDSKEWAAERGRHSRSENGRKRSNEAKEGGGDVAAF